MCSAYFFQDEIIEATIKRCIPAVGDEKLDGLINYMDWGGEEYLETVLVLRSDEVNAVAQNILLDLEGRRSANSVQRSILLNKIENHDLCRDLLNDLKAQRNDSFSAIWDSRTLCLDDGEVGRYGEMYVELEEFLETLRPRTKEAKRRSLPDFQVEISKSSDEYWEDIFDENYANKLEELAAQEVRNHKNCYIVANEFYDQIDFLSKLVEVVAAKAKANVEYGDGEGVYFYVHKVLPLLKVDALFDAMRSGQLSANTTIYPAIKDPDYCDQGKETHVDPHRACRYA